MCGSVSDCNPYLQTVERTATDGRTDSLTNNHQQVASISRTHSFSACRVTAVIGVGQTAVVAVVVNTLRTTHHQHHHHRAHVRFVHEVVGVGAHVVDGLALALVNLVFGHFVQQDSQDKFV